MESTHKKFLRGFFIFLIAVGVIFGVTRVFAISSLSFTNGIINASGSVGIGTISPNQKLEVVGSISSTALCLGGVCNSTWSSNSQWTASGTSLSYTSGNVSVGSNKITAGTFDPAYVIDGQGYATYLSGMTGEKEETVGTVMLSAASQGDYEASLNFGSAAKGSDLWLWRNVIDPSQNFDYVSVLLTPGFNGNAWYVKDGAHDRIVIHGTAAGEVSYQLAGRRFDWPKWGNGTVDTGGIVVSNQ
jgi:hypothetical protein